MALYKYQKNSSTRKFQASKDEFLIRDYKNNKGLVTNILQIPKNIHKDLSSLMQKSTTANLVIPLIFIGIGAVFIYKEYFPDIQAALQTSSGYLSQGNVSPVSDQYI